MRSVMAVLEGVLAIHKPTAISSFDVIRTVTPLFRQSPLFQPLIERSRANAGQKRKKARQARLDELKIGHGGTLDPLATGVLIVGIGNGTKSLQAFLEGTKEYECTVLFGAATDSYDIMGKVTKTASWDHITKEKVEKALDTLRGPQMQLPPVYSSIRVDGKHLYEYAREGLPLPEIKRRNVTVHELEMLEWLPSDKHNHEIPSQEADAEAKIIAERAAWPKSLLDKRKRETSDSGSEPAAKVARSSEPTAEAAETTAEPASAHQVDIEANAVSETSPQAVSDAKGDSKPRPPAARISMKVSSGFYVRSLCHDLGVALDSAGLMATLVRSRQSGFELGKNVIEYDDFEKGPEVWEPQVKTSLEEWQAKKVAENGDGETHKRSAMNGIDRHVKSLYGNRRSDHERGKKFPPRRRNSSSPEPERRDQRSRNSSSPEPEKRRRRNSSSVEP